MAVGGFRILSGLMNPISKSEQTLAHGLVMVDNHWGRMMDDSRVRNGRHDGLDQGHRMVDNGSVVDERGVVHDGVGNDRSGDQLRCGVVDNVAVRGRNDMDGNKFRNIRCALNCLRR